MTNGICIIFSKYDINSSTMKVSEILQHCNFPLYITIDKSKERIMYLVSLMCNISNQKFTARSFDEITF